MRRVASGSVAISTTRRHPAQCTHTSTSAGRALDNQVRLQPGVASAFVRVGTVLRAFVEQHWAAKVAKLNGSQQVDMREFLFGAEREDLGPVRPGLVELQHGACFYCGGALRKAEVHVDHFLPWARYPNNSLYNLVAADARCNGDKRALLAAVGHVDRWRGRMTEQGEALTHLAGQAHWALGDERVLGAARSLYLGLPAASRLWLGPGRREPVAHEPLRAALR
ncbi:MAG: hypothetical protein FJ108_16520 [Deltaproteobacteria bacterium]|nr:hypothetical protein [Deltaproteobacteria bacterium]